MRRVGALRSVSLDMLLAGAVFIVLFGMAAAPLLAGSTPVVPIGVPCWDC